MFLHVVVGWPALMGDAVRSSAAHAPRATTLAA
jgi:hypothetical protein